MSSSEEREEGGAPVQWTKEWKEFAESSREKRKSPFLVLYMGLLRLVEEVTSMVGVEGEATSKSW